MNKSKRKKFSYIELSKKTSMRSLFLLFLWLPYALTAQTEATDIHGKWSGSDTVGMDAIFIFQADGYAFIGNGEQLIGGEEYTMQGEKLKMTYTIDMSKKPMHLDLIIENSNGERKMMVPLIFEFLDANSIKILGGESDVRPTVFDGESIVFKRVKE